MTAPFPTDGLTASELGREQSRSLYTDRSRALQRGDGLQQCGSHETPLQPEPVHAMFIKRGDRYELLGPREVEESHNPLIPK